MRISHLNPQLVSENCSKNGLHRLLGILGGARPIKFIAKHFEKNTKYKKGVFGSLDAMDTCTYVLVALFFEIF